MNDIEKAKQLAELEEQLDKQKAELEAKKIELDKKELEIRLEVEKEKCKFVTDFMLNITRNINYHRSFYGEVPGGVQPFSRDQYGNTQGGYAEKVEIANNIDETAT